MAYSRDPYDPARTAAIAGGWQDRAACKDIPAEHVIRAHCGACPVTLDCGRWVIPMTNSDDPGGIVAGMDAGERAQVRRELARRRAAKTPAKTTPPPELPIMKRCRKCTLFRHRDDFHRESRSSDGLSGICAPCKREADAVYRHRRRSDAAVATEALRAGNRKKAAA